MGSCQVVLIFLLNKGGLNDEALCTRLLRIVFLESIRVMVTLETNRENTEFFKGFLRILAPYITQFLNNRNKQVLAGHKVTGQAILDLIPRGYLKNVFQKERRLNTFQIIDKLGLASERDGSGLLNALDGSKNVLLYLLCAEPVGRLQMAVNNLILSPKGVRDYVNEVDAIYSQIGDDDYTLEHYKTEIKQNIAWLKSVRHLKRSNDVLLSFCYVSIFKYCLEMGESFEDIDELLKISTISNKERPFEVLRDVFELLRELLTKNENRVGDEKYCAGLRYLDGKLTQKMNELQLPLVDMEDLILGYFHKSKPYVLISRSMPQLAELVWRPLLEQYNIVCDKKTLNYSENIKIAKQIAEKFELGHEGYTLKSFEEQLNVFNKRVAFGIVHRTATPNINRLHFLMSLLLSFETSGPYNRVALAYIEKLFRKEKKLDYWYAVFMNLSDELLRSQSLHVYLRLKLMVDRLVEQSDFTGSTSELRKKILTPYEEHAKKKVALISNSTVTSWKLFEGLKLAEALTFNETAEVVNFLNERLKSWTRYMGPVSYTKKIENKIDVMARNDEYLAAPREKDKRREFYDNILNALAILINTFDRQYEEATNENEKKKCIDEVKTSLGEINYQFRACCSQWLTVIKRELRRIQSGVMLSPEDEFHKQAMNLRVKIYEDAAIETFNLKTKDIHIYNRLFNEYVSKKFKVPYLQEYHVQEMPPKISDQLIDVSIEAYTPMRVFSNFADRFIFTSTQDTELDDFFNEVKEDILLSEYESVFEYVDDEPSSSTLLSRSLSSDSVFDDVNSHDNADEKKKIKNELKTALKGYLGRSDAQLDYFRRNIEAIVTNMGFDGDDADQQKSFDCRCQETY